MLICSHKNGTTFIFVLILKLSLQNNGGVLNNNTELLGLKAFCICFGTILRRAKQHAKNFRRLSHHKIWMLFDWEYISTLVDRNAN